MEKRICMLLVNLFFLVGMAFAQTGFSGTVISGEDGQPIIGASVMVQGSKTGTVTDVDGKFTIAVPAGQKLVISYVGMETITVTPKDAMTVTLHPNTTLNEVVVTGITQQDKRLFSGAAT